MLEREAGASSHLALQAMMLVLLHSPSKTDSHLNTHVFMGQICASSISSQRQRGAKVAWRNEFGDYRRHPGRR